MPYNAWRSAIVPDVPDAWVAARKTARTSARPPAHVHDCALQPTGVRAPAPGRLPVVQKKPSPCAWCGRPVPEVSAGRRRRYCRQSCRQRAYEQRHALVGTDIPPDAVILSAEDARAAADRAFQLRCACEDVATAVAEDAPRDELVRVCADLVRLARDAERLR